MWVTWVAQPRKTTPLKVDDSGWVGLRWWTVRPRDCRFTFCAVALGQRQHDSDATLKAFLSRRQVDALQSKYRDSGWHFTGHSCWAATACQLTDSWRVVCLVCVISITIRVSWLELCVCWCVSVSVHPTAIFLLLFLTRHYLTNSYILNWPFHSYSQMSRKKNRPASVWGANKCKGSNIQLSMEDMPAQTFNCWSLLKNILRVSLTFADSQRFYIW